MVEHLPFKPEWKVLWQVRLLRAKLFYCKAASVKRVETPATEMV